MNELLRIEIQKPEKYQRILGAKIIEGVTEYYLGEYIGDDHMEDDECQFIPIDYWASMPDLPSDGLPL